MVVQNRLKSVIDFIPVNSIIQGDCLEILKTLPDSCIDLILTDPPYYRVKKHWWDRQWKSPEKFIEWLDSIAFQWARVLKSNGSLYCFASSRMAARVEVALGKRFNVINRITWDKGHLPSGGIHKRACKQKLRGFFPASEAIIFCEQFNGDCLAKNRLGDVKSHFIFEPLRAYLDGERKRAGCSRKESDRICGNQMSSHYYGSSQWVLPTQENYLKLQQAFPDCFTRSYELLQQEYESLRRPFNLLMLQKYRRLRRPFNVSENVPYTDVWLFPTVNSYQGKHPCEKPSALLEHMILTSSHPQGIVLDCFAGSGSTLLAAKKLNRSFIGIEIDSFWVEKINQKISSYNGIEPDLFEVPTYVNQKRKEKIIQLSFWD